MFKKVAFTMYNATDLARARQFYEFVTTQEALIEQAELFHRIPVRNDIPQESLPEWMRGDIAEMDVDWTHLRENEADWMTRWRDQVKGRN